MQLGYKVHGFVCLASAKFCSVFGLDVSTLWSLFGLNLDVVVKSLGVPSSLGGLEEKQLQEVDMRLMWTGAILVFSLAPSDIR